MTTFFLAIALLVQGQQQTGFVSGQLRGADGRSAVNVRVAAMALPDPATGAGEGALVSLTQTDAAGRYRLENIPPGRYYILAGLIDAPTYYPGATSLGNATSIAVAAGEEVKGLDFNMARGTGVRVSGRMPPGVRASYVGISGGSGPFTANTTQVKPDGSFEFLRVPPGNYMLTTPGASGLPTLPIVVSDKDVDVGLPPGPGVRVSGMVGLGPSSPRPANGKVLLTAGSSAWASIEAPVGADGRFEFPSVPAGVYTARTIPGGGAAAGTVVVADRDVLGIVLPAIVELNGKAVLQVGSAPPALSPALMIEAKRANGTTLATAIRQDGSFKFPLPEGEYRIAFGKLPRGFSLKSISYGSIDLLKDPLTLDGSSEAREIRVHLEKTQ